MNMGGEKNLKVTHLALPATNQMWNSPFLTESRFGLLLFLQQTGWCTKDPPPFSINFQEDRSSEGEKLCVTAGPDEDKCIQQVSYC